MPFGRQKPDSQLYFRTASEVSKQVAGTLNDLTGGSKWEPGLVDISPEVFDHLGEFVLGGLGRTVGRVVDLPVKMAEGDVPVRAIPFLRQVYQEPYQRIDLDRFYGNIQKVTNTKSAYKEVPLSEQVTFRKDHPEIKLAAQANLAKKQISSLRKQYYRAQDSGEKRVAQNLEEKMTNIAKRFNKVYNANIRN